MTEVGVTISGFEGPEKRLEIDFKPNPSKPHGLRMFSKDQWQEMLNFSSCTIISQMSNEFCDAYVLSESSLFVFPFKLMIKTCGTTTLLKIIPKLLEYAGICQLSVDYVMYSRKNFLFPDKQIYPHIDWRVELDYLDQHFDGQSYILGPITKDHWYLYVADYSEPCDAASKEVTLEIMMHKLDRMAASKFYRTEECGERDKFPGISQLIQDEDTDEFNFTPCGYSMNGLADKVYSTIHVTPEPQCSYASFETNLPVASYKNLVLRVFEIFKPGTVTLTLFRENTDSEHDAFDFELPGYTMRYKTVSELGGNRNVVFCNYELGLNDTKNVNRRRPIMN
jgi:S-adenosylmethionine decarboxylase